MKILVILMMCAAVASSTDEPSCVRAPPHAQPADAYYKLGVAGDPDLFVPGELYIVSLQGVNSGEGPTPFTGFTIWTEPAVAPTEPQTSTAIPTAVTNLTLGAFQAHDSQSKQSDQCRPAVVNATSHPKTDIQVIWSAPVSASDMCIRLCARAGPNMVKDSGSWSVLARKLCAAPATPVAFERQPPIVEPCCACDEAKYEVTFEGLWSRYTHPREFPSEAARAHFSDVIGASHTAQYRVWQEGRVASPGLRRLADDGATTALEKELKEESDHIRTIIKARGISWQQVGGNGGAGVASTFAVFRVDPRHHLVSLASKMAPSPDWIVGVSALELCNINCTWRRMATVPLYPYDAGTDNGISYTSRREPTVPPVAVRALRPDWPRDSRSPFFNPSGEMRPFARLRLNRLRLYEKKCDPAAASKLGLPFRLLAADDTLTVNSDTVPTGGSGACATYNWAAWSACSVSCGRGRAVRQRQYVLPSRAYAEGCRVPLTDYTKCHGPRLHCRAVSEYEPDPAESSGPCAVSKWSEWSRCAGCGVRARTRHYVGHRAFKRCHIGYRSRTILHQALPCEAGPCHRPSDPKLANSTNFDWFFKDRPRGECRTTEWSWWSPCSARCGEGRRMRNRYFIHRNSTVTMLLMQILTSRWNQIFSKWQGIDVPEKVITAPNPEIDLLRRRHETACQLTLTMQESLCQAESAQCPNPDRAVCGLPKSVGHCRSYDERWFYDVKTGRCEPFGYTGCGGNGNNFRARDDCETICADHKEILEETTTTSTSTTMATTTKQRTNSIKVEAVVKKTKMVPSVLNNEVMAKDASVDVKDVDCRLGPWLGWNQCVGNCDYGVQVNYRNMMRPITESGRTCPADVLIKSRNCKPQHCRRSFLLLADPPTSTTTQEPRQKDEV